MKRKPVRVRVIVVNCNWAVRASITGRAIEKMTAEHHPDFILAVETKRLRVADYLPHGWRAFQGHKAGKQNGAVAWARGQVKSRRFRLGTRAHGVRMLPRWAVRANLRFQNRPVSIESVHLPPSRYSHLYGKFVANLRRAQRPRNFILGGDKNQANLSSVTKGMHVLHEGVIFLATTEKVLSRRAVSYQGLDHKVLIVDLELTA